MATAPTNVNAGIARSQSGDQTTQDFILSGSVISVESGGALQVKTGGAILSNSGTQATNIVAITDSTGGTASSTYAALTNIIQITDSTGGTASATFAAITNPAANATSSLTADVLAIKNALAEIAAQLNLQKTFNGSVLNALATTAAKVNAINAAIQGVGITAAS